MRSERPDGQAVRAVGEEQGVCQLDFLLSPPRLHQPHANQGHPGGADHDLGRLSRCQADGYHMETLTEK